MSPYPMNPNLQHSPTIIGIAGRKRVGKNTVANNIGNYFDERLKVWFIRSFAQPIRDTSYVLGWSASEMDIVKDATHPIWEMSWRQFAQRLGDAFRNDIRSDVLLKMMDIQLSKIGKHVDYVIIDDIRMQNEVDYVLNKGGFIVNVLRENVLPQTEYQKEIASHSTEQGIIRYQYTLGNNDSLIKLKSNCVQLAKDILEWSRSKNNVTQKINGRPNNVG